MTTRILKAQMGNISEDIKIVAKNEGVSSKTIRDMLAQGRIVILKNKLKKELTPIAIGDTLKTKVTATIATNNCETSLSESLDKLRVAQLAEVDCILDLSVGSYIEETRQSIISNSKVPTGTSPMLQIGYGAINEESGISSLLKHDFLNIVEKHCMDGVDFVCLHCGMIKKLTSVFKENTRVSNLTSRAAQMLFDWMEETGCENPYYENFDELLAILKEYDVTLFLSPAFKSGSVSDAFDSLQIMEYTVMSELVKRCHKAGVQVVSDGIGHAPLNKIPSLVNLIKETTLHIPLFISSSSVCDCAIGYDNITSAIANSICASNGANLLNATSSVDYLYPSNAAQIREGIMSAKVAAHSADLANGHIDTQRQNYKLSFARANENWKNIIKNSIDKTVFDGLKHK